MYKYKKKKSGKIIKKIEGDISFNLARGKLLQIRGDRNLVDVVFKSLKWPLRIGNLTTGMLDVGMCVCV